MRAFAGSRGIYRSRRRRSQVSAPAREAQLGAGDLPKSTSFWLAVEKSAPARSSTQRSLTRPARRRTGAATDPKCIRRKRQRMVLWDEGAHRREQEQARSFVRCDPGRTGMTVGVAGPVARRRNAVCGDSAYRGQTAVIRDKAPCAVDFTQPHSSRASVFSKQQRKIQSQRNRACARALNTSFMFSSGSLVLQSSVSWACEKRPLVGGKLHTFESVPESNTLAAGVARPKNGSNDPIERQKQRERQELMLKPVYPSKTTQIQQPSSEHPWRRRNRQETNW